MLEQCTYPVRVSYLPTPSVQSRYISTVCRQLYEEKAIGLLILRLVFEVVVFFSVLWPCFYLMPVVFRMFYFRSSIFEVCFFSGTCGFKVVHFCFISHVYSGGVFAVWDCLYLEVRGCPSCYSV